MEKIRFGVIGLGNQGSNYILNNFDKGKIENGIVTAAGKIIAGGINQAFGISY